MAVFQKFVESGFPINFSGFLKLIGIIFGKLSFFIFPLSGFLAVFFVFNRLYQEKELLAFFSLGFKYEDFWRVIFCFSLFSLCLQGFSLLVLKPWAHRKYKDMKVDLINQGIKEVLLKKKKGVFENFYFYKSEKGGIFLFKKGKRKFFLLFAEKTDFSKFPERLFLFNGSQFRGSVNFNNKKEQQGKYESMIFQKYELNFSPFLNFEKKNYSFQAMSLRELLKMLKDRKESVLSEIFFRFFGIFLSFFSVIFAFLFLWKRIHLSKLRKFLEGILFFLCYFFIYNFGISVTKGKSFWAFLFYLIFYSFSLFFAWILNKTARRENIFEKGA